MAIILLSVAILIMSAVFHEYAHGWVAYMLGDNTAKSLGRLSLNPLDHLDPVGSVFLPLLLALSGSPVMFGWAKPVPFNPNNLSDSKYGELKVAIGGPIANLILALFFGAMSRVLAFYLTNKDLLVSAFFRGDYDFLLSQMNGSVLSSLFVMALIACFINLILMFFNLIPIPPLDGSKVLMAFLPYEWQVRLRGIEQYGFFIIILLMISGFINYLFIPVYLLFQLLIGF